MADLSSVTIDNLLSETDPYNSYRNIPSVGDSKFTTQFHRTRTFRYWKMCTGNLTDDEGNEFTCTRHTNRFGYLVVGPGVGNLTVHESHDFQLGKHATPLDVKLALAADGTFNNMSEMCNPATRFRPLIRNQGLHLMPIQQMAEYGWHHLPSIVETFPELAEIQDIYCEYGCPKDGPQKRWFLTEEDLASHVSVVHKDAAAPRAMGQVINEGMAKYMQPQTLSESQIAAIVAATVKALKAAESK